MKRYLKIFLCFTKSLGSLTKSVGDVLSAYNKAKALFLASRPMGKNIHLYFMSKVETVDLSTLLL